MLSRRLDGVFVLRVRGAVLTTGGLGTRLLPTSKELSKEVTPNFLGLRISAVEVKLSLLRSFPL